MVPVPLSMSRSSFDQNCGSGVDDVGLDQIFIALKIEHAEVMDYVWVDDGAVTVMKSTWWVGVEGWMAEA